MPTVQLTKSIHTFAIAAMENWEFLLQRKGDKSWLPLESPTVEILEGQYRLAARSKQGNLPVGIAIAYRPPAEVRHEPFQQKITKRLSHDGLLIVMPYTHLMPGFWEIECAIAGEPMAKAVKFDVISASPEGGDWQYYEPDPEDASDDLALDPENTYGEGLRLVPNEGNPPASISPILEIAEQRSTELVQSMFEEFPLFDEDEEEGTARDENAASDRKETALSEAISIKTGIETDIETGIEEPDSILSSQTSSQSSSQTPSQADSLSLNQPRILIRLHQPQYLVNDDNTFTLTGEAYAKGDVEVCLKDPQTLEVVVNQRYAIADGVTGDSSINDGAIAFSFRIDVPPPEQVQVLIGEVLIHPYQEFTKYQQLWIMQQAIAVSYPASRVLPSMLKAAREAAAQAPPEVRTPPQAPTATTAPAKPSKSSLSLPPLPSNKAKSNSTAESNRPPLSLSLPPLPTPPPNVDTTLADEPLAEIDPLQQLEAEFARINFADESLQELVQTTQADFTETNPSPTVEEPELVYSFEEELPPNYDEIIAKQRTEPELISNLPPINRPKTSDRSQRFLNKLQNLSAEAIAAQKESQRQEELILDTFPPSDPRLDNLAVPFVNDQIPDDPSTLSIDLEHPTDARTIAESNSLAALDRQLDAEFDRLLTPNPDLILNEYVWEETVDPNTFPIAGFSNTGATLAETAQTIRNLQDHQAAALPEQEPIPIPEIIVPEGEILSGTPMIAIVRLALPTNTTSLAIAPKFFIKFWIKDLQTRTTIDGPRWLLDFNLVPDTTMIETRTNISIPLSSIEVAFEAIAIESQTQRESHKARITRPVVPPNI